MAYNDTQARLIATLIAGQKAPGQPFVFAFNNTLPKPVVYWSSYVRGANVPRSQTVDVLQAVYQGRSSENPGIRFYYSPGNQTATSMCNGMIAFLGINPVQAAILPGAGPGNYPAWNALFPNLQAPARVAGLNAFQQHMLGPQPNVDIRTDNPAIGGQPSTHTIHRIYMMAAFALAELRGRGAPGGGHNIGALLVGPDGTVLGWGLNTKNSNYTFHAEVNAVQSYYNATNAPIPDGSRLYTTLKPCKMCAGMIRASTPTDQQIKVYYGQHDPGAHAANTALDAPAGMVTKLGVGGSKPLKTYNAPAYDTAVVSSPDLGNTLHHHRGQAIGQGIYPLTAFLLQPAALNDMTEARVSLLRKGDKYDTPYFGNENVRPILRHLSPFLASCGLPEWNGVQIPAD